MFGHKQINYISMKIRKDSNPVEFIEYHLCALQIKQEVCWAGLLPSVNNLVGTALTENWHTVCRLGASQWAETLPAMQETPDIWVQCLGREDPLEEGHGNPL